MREILNAIRNAQNSSNKNHWEMVNETIPSHTAEAKAKALPVMYKGERMEEDSCDPSYWEVAEEQLRTPERKGSWDEEFLDDIQDEYYRLIADGENPEDHGFTFTPFVK